jgi:hypothetical protein
MRKEKKSLAETHPEIAKQWHLTKNGDLTPFDITPGYGKKVWWKCPEGDDHEWEAIVKNRTKGARCAICHGKKVVQSNCLQTLNPNLSKQWHPTRNKDLSPLNFTAGSHKKVWWKCHEDNDHEWIAPIGDRNNGRGCPICRGLKVVKSNCLLTTHPKISSEWYYKKNGKITPKNIIAGSSKKVWWKCPKGDDHEWEASPNNRTNNKSGCPVCKNQKVVKTNSLEYVNPKLSREWHPTKNKLKPSDVVEKSTLNVWWKCPKGDDHEWITRVVDRVYGNRCPVCSGRKLGNSNSLANISPKISLLWHPTKNGNLTPKKIITNSHKKVWWKCTKGDDHEWEASPNTLVQNKKNSDTNGCPICRGLKVVNSNSLANTNIELTKEWHIGLNEKGPESFTINSGKKVWWKCKKDENHIWKATISNRSYGSGCPFCDLTPQSKQELIITFELKKLFRNIDPKGLKTKLEGKLRAVDIFIPKLNLCIEFDGSYWHKDKRDIDKIKSEMLFKEGFKLIRVREEPLKKIYDTDVISKQPYNGKKVTNDILSMIILLFNLDDKLVSKLKEYQSKESLQNEKGLDKYIDKILTEKAENKNDS